MKIVVLPLCVLLGATPVLAQSVPSLRRPVDAPGAEIARHNAPDLVGLRINGGTYPRYRTGGEVEITSTDITAAGPRVRIEMYPTLDGGRVVLQPSAQSDGRVVARLPADFYARRQPMTTVITIGSQETINRTGVFEPDIVSVPADVVKAGITVICSTMCVSWPPSVNRQPNWRSSSQIYDSFERDSSVSDRVGGQWSIGQTTYRLTTRKLKDQFRFTRVRFISPSIAGGCPSNINDNTWLYPGLPLPPFDPEGPFSSGPLEIYARANVTHCRELSGGSFAGTQSATHFVFTIMNVEVEIEGPKGIDPWQ